MTATTTTTIRDVSIFSRQRTRRADLFDIALSPQGIAIQRPGRNEQHMSWERIVQWEIQERPDCLVLTLRGDGSVTPLMVKGWTLEDLETVMREATTGVTDATDPLPAAPTVPPGGVASETAPPAAAIPRSARRQPAHPSRRSARKVFVTIVLLGALATAVTLVLLQSAGVISWSFLGPVA